MSAPVQPPLARQPLPEFIAMMALVFAVIAFSIDSMLPAPSFRPALHRLCPTHSAQQLF